MPLRGRRVIQRDELAALSQSLKLANENPARKIEVRLQADEQAAAKAGAIDAIVAVADETAWKAMRLAWARLGASSAAQVMASTETVAR